jgi:thioredoxin 1
MAILDLDKDNFEQTVARGGIVLVDCWAAWCGACKTFGPVFEGVAKRYPNHTFGKIDAQKEKDLVKELGIENIPTLLLFRDGILLFQQPGYFEDEKLDDILSQAESLDMDLVRADMDAEQSKE